MICVLRTIKPRGTYKCCESRDCHILALVLVIDCFLCSVVYSDFSRSPLKSTVCFIVAHKKTCQ